MVYNRQVAKIEARALTSEALIEHEEVLGASDAEICDCENSYDDGDFEDYKLMNESDDEDDYDPNDSYWDDHFAYQFSDTSDVLYRWDY